jgi:hypothetical protein
VTVDHCAIKEKSYCELIRRNDYHMNVKFTPQFEGSNLTMLAYAMINGKAVAFAGMNGQACDYMKCPIASGTQQSYIFNVNVDANKPYGKFNVRWIMKQGDENRCCFANKFKIV